MEILPRATAGVGIVLEHRYYGKSIPVSIFFTDNLRWLNNAQSAADSANFLANVKFEGIEEDLTAPNTPWIYYGGSYAGARAAHIKVLYLDLVYGAISSNGVTHPDYLNWEYYKIIRNAAELVCMEHLKRAIQTIDTILAKAQAVPPRGKHMRWAAQRVVQRGRRRTPGWSWWDSQRKREPSREDFWAGIPSVSCSVVLWEAPEAVLSSVGCWVEVSFSMVCLALHWWRAQRRGRRFARWDSEWWIRS
ncbi:unnamed protein product [Mycena citricolor]|uniref:Uncharacterized protein n=2 Tax=Mycena citricolor TaxID=2018698 RepID=A0AAD2HIC2_9AGAR|nr:unnamed protein product [Mycena citricolor]